MLPTVSRRNFLQKEEKYKEDVYLYIEHSCQEAKENVADKDKEVDYGAYEEQDKFVPYRERGEAWNKRHEVEAEKEALYPKPYFAHIELTETDGGNQEQLHFFLSDCPVLNRVISINENKYLIPFKRDKNHPMWERIFHCYQLKNGETFHFEQRDGNNVFYTPCQICSDEIENRKLLNANLLYPKSEFSSLLDADELLEQKLQDNRSNPTLRNIIATLQEEQFRIISAAPNTSFVVQGCAGSGKSQCLLHRLFYLRDELSDAGWNRVLLLIPTKLFKTFSSELMRRYQIDKVASYSVAELYHRLLKYYDGRFHNRQYQIEYSEEYLPDEYLRSVYSDEMIYAVTAKIEQAISAQIQTVSNVLGKEPPKTITSETIPKLILELDASIRELDRMDTILKQDEEYAKKEETYQNFLDEIEALQKKQAIRERDKKQLQSDEETLSIYLDRERRAQAARQQWTEQRNRKIRDAENYLCQHVKKMNSTSFEVIDPAEYARRLFYVQDLTKGQTYKADEVYLSYLNATLSEAETNLKTFTKGKTVEDFQAQSEKRAAAIDQILEKYTNKRTKLLEDAALLEVWLRHRRTELVGIETSSKTLSREELRHTRNSLTHLESTIFDKQIWNALLPIKERDRIPTEITDGRQKKKRILYKSDLLYYLKIYLMLHPDIKLSDYEFICIDEGQDLQKADYKLLRQLYPNAALNIFGDKGQVLHNGCGVTDWKLDTGIDNLYIMERNYRNPAAIIDFCNRNFGFEMQYLGKVKKEQQPIYVSDIKVLNNLLKTAKPVTILKDKESFLKFCNAIGKTNADLEYLDTDSEQPSGKKPACYSIFAAKGLEFASVFVFPDGMSRNQKMVACTRATKILYYYDEP